ncbi:hypothetical protein [Ferviditalea candida]|uniref:Uncharacterized protein n=1 Tax=Ferviditalea candida TaxID=3108399 RepID=A0ABU5ZP23_9BACL|nr:hypothetical protein [Paenibacillaceae bacterium T2]
MRNQLLPFMVNKEVVQKRLRNQISEIAVHYRESPIVKEHRTFLQQLKPHHVHAGDRAPDVYPMVGPDGVERRLFQFLRDTRHTLLLAAADSSDLERERSKLAALDRWKHDLEIYLIWSGQKH